MLVNKKRWNPQDKIRIVLESLNTNITIAELCRKYQITPVVFYSWRQRFIDGGKAALTTDRRTNRNNGGNLAAENDRLKRLIGELTIANDALKKTLEGDKR